MRNQEKRRYEARKSDDTGPGKAITRGQEKRKYGAKKSANTKSGSNDTWPEKATIRGQEKRRYRARKSDNTEPESDDTEPEKATIRGQIKSNNTRPQKQQYKSRRAPIWGRQALSYPKICGLILDNFATQSLQTTSSRFFCSLFSLASSLEAVFVLFTFVLSPFLLHSKCTRYSKYLYWMRQNVYWI